MNINEAIRSATLETWDEPIENHQHWRSHNLLNSDGTEKFRQTLYVHVLLNDLVHPIYDNNSPTAKLIIQEKSYMVKFGRCLHGVLLRRQDDFKNHYHHRDGIELPDLQAVKLTPYKRNVPNPKPEKLNRRIGSSASKLHLIIDLNKTNANEIRRSEGLESRLKEFFRNRLMIRNPYLNSSSPTSERINIPMSSIENEDNFLKEITELFEEFRASIQ